MFRCDACGAMTEPGQPRTEIVVETREVIYPSRFAANRGGQDDPGGRGYSSVKVAGIGPCCGGRKREVRRLTGLAPPPAEPEVELTRPEREVEVKRRSKRAKFQGDEASA